MQRIKKAYAENGDLKIIPETPPLDGSENWEQGRGAYYELDNDPNTGDPLALDIDREQDNYFKNVISKNIKHWQENSYPIYFDDIEYPKNATVKYTDGNTYVSKVDNNTALPTNATNWTIYDPLSLDGQFVKLTENQTIAGVKTFTSSPIVPTPTANFQVATKKYVDDVASVGGSGLSIADKTKLNGIEEQATKNKTDEFLLNRSNHTGTIPMSAVENLDQKLASISVSGSMNSFNGRTGNVSPKIGDYASDMITETTEKQFVSNDEKISWNRKLADASMDSKLYGRKNGEWAEIVNTGGGTNAEIVAITNKLDAKGVEANKVLVSNGDDTSEWKDYNTYSYTESEIAPLNPKLGDDWRDTASGKLYKWSSVGGVAEWSEIGAGSSSGGFNPDNDIMLSAGKGVVMTSGNGTMYKLYIDNDGRLTTEVI